MGSIFETRCIMSATAADEEQAIALGTVEMVSVTHSSQVQPHIRDRLPTVGSRVFPIAGAKVWNSLQDDVTSALSLSTFRRHLKTYLFRCCYNTD